MGIEPGILKKRLGIRSKLLLMAIENGFTTLPKTSTNSVTSIVACHTAEFALEQGGLRSQ